MRVSIEPEFFEYLSQRALTTRTVDDITRAHDAIWLHTDMGPTFYMTRDGRLIGTDLDRDVPTDLPDSLAYAALVCAARNHAEPRLLDLLPPKPVHSVVCPKCAGTRWWSLRRKDKKEFSIVCPDCSGLGWLAAKDPER